MNETAPGAMVDLQAPNDRSPVKITAASGRIRIVAPALFAPADTSPVHRLIERLLRIEEVDRIDVHHDAEEVELTYDSRRLGLKPALSRFAAALERDGTLPQSSASRHIDLESVLGHVLHVERRRFGDGVMTTIVSAGTDLWKTLAPRMRKSATPRSNHVHRDTQRLLMNGYSIRYVPFPESDAATPALFTPNEVPTVALIDARSTGVPAPPTTIVVAHGWRRAANLAAAGGCFCLSIVGLVTPGIPTVPFVLATSYFLVRSSPALDERLRRSRLFGQLVRDWTTYGGMRPRTKFHIVVITLAIMGGTLLLVEPSPPILLGMAVMGTIGVSLILSAPTVPQDAPDDVRALLPT